MKRLLIILLLTFFTSKSQNNLEFNRIIDTVLVLSIPDGTQLNSALYSNDNFGPENGKVWKINQVLAQSSELIGGLLICSTSNYHSNGSMLRSALIIDDGLNSMPLCISAFEGYTGVMPPPGISACELIDFPLWVSDGSSIQVSVYHAGNGNGLCTTGGSNDAKFFISLIEFNVFSE